MSKHGTALSVGQFAEFSSAVLRNLPRDIDPSIARGWMDNGKSLACALHEALCPPTQFERNEHGHIMLTFDGLDLTGSEEIERLTAAGVQVSDWTKLCMLSTKKDSYDKNHRLVAGKRYTIALVPTQEIKRDSDCTTDTLRKRGIEKYGYEKPLAGIVPRIRESVSDEQMEEMGFWYIAALHDPIKESGGDPSVLDARRDGDGLWLRASFALPVSRWHGSGAFAFLVPAR